MASAFRREADAWTAGFDEVKALAQEVVQLIQERNTNHPNGGPEASRMTASARRKLGTLGTQIERWFSFLDSPEAQALSEQEKHRRRDLLYALKSRREQMLHSLKRAQQQDREALLSGNGANSSISAAGNSGSRETDQTAVLDNQGLLSLQERVMRQQDLELEEMEKAVGSTKHVALAIGEEADLHTRLLTELEDDVAVTHSRLRVAVRKMRQIMARGSNWRGGLFIFLLIITLVFVLVMAFKLR